MNTPAQQHAAATASNPVQAVGVATIWQSRFKPRHLKWVSGRFGTHAYNMTVKYQCWNGGDGTKAKAKIVEDDYPYRTVGSHSYAYRNGTWWNTAYRIVVEQNHGRTHSEQVGGYEYN